MSDIGAIVLHKILRDKHLEAWSRIKLAFLDPAYSGIYTAINKHYSKYSCIPSFEDLEVTSRDTPLNRSLASLKDLDIPDVDIELAVDALINTYTQNEALKYIEKFVDKVTLLDSEEIKESLSEIVLRLDEKVHTSESVVSMNNIKLFQEKDISTHSHIPLGINNSFDAAFSGIQRQELILIGGKRGSGKSIVCSNITTNQYEQGNVSVYFTVEMKAKEVMERNMAILANVSHSKIRQNTLDLVEKLRLAKIRASMFIEADSLYTELLEHKDVLKFEDSLIKNYELKKDNQIVIIDDRELTITSIDLHLQKLKAQFGDKLTIAVIDYLNQIVVPGNESAMYDWTTQIFISKKLKEFARKYDIGVISPYQIDDSGGTRFAKGILDAPDMALLLETHRKEDQAITFETTKVRSGAPIKVTSGIDWDSLKIQPVDVPEPRKEKKTETKKLVEPIKDEGDLPWH